MNGKWLLSSLFVLALLLVTNAAEAGKRNGGWSKGSFDGGCPSCPPSSGRYGRWESSPPPSYYGGSRYSKSYSSYPPADGRWYPVGGGSYSSGWYPCDGCPSSGYPVSGYPHQSGPIYSAPKEPQQLAPAPAPAPAGQQFAPAPAPSKQ